MIPVKQIVFEQVEGLFEDCHPLTFTSFTAVEEHVRAAARRAPTDGSYYKCDVSIEWADGTTQYFRFDMNREHAMVVDPIANELRAELLLYSECWAGHMSIEEYKQFLDQAEDRERVAKILDTCDVGTWPGHDILREAIVAQQIEHLRRAVFAPKKGPSK